MAGDAPPGLYRSGRSLRARLSVAVWIVFVAFPLVAAYRAPGATAGHLAVVSVTAAVLCAVYVAYAAVPDPMRAGMDHRLLGGMVVLVAGAVSFLVLYDGPAWDYSYVYCLWPAVAAAGNRPWPVMVLTGLAVGMGSVGGLGGGDLFSVAVVVFGTGAGVYGVTQLVAANEALHRAQADLAAAAIAEERLRFARDLHELLGHSLSVIALKSQVASRLLTEQPARAGKEIREVEQITHQALQEVRDAVSGYRRTTLAAELEGARGALESAGIRLEERIGQPQLPSAIESVLAWALREGITNVIRHSGASRCTMTLDVDTARALLTVADDGIGPGAPGAHPEGPGNGLRGLAERVRASGGTLHTASAVDGGFRLEASIPLPAGWSTRQAARGAQPTSVVPL